MTATELRMHEAGMDTDWLDLATRTGFKQQHNISFRGGVNKTNYFVSLNYTDVERYCRRQSIQTLQHPFQPRSGVHFPGLSSLPVPSWDATTEVAAVLLSPEHSA